MAESYRTRRRGRALVIALVFAIVAASLPAAAGAQAPATADTVDETTAPAAGLQIDLPPELTTALDGGAGLFAEMETPLVAGGTGIAGAVIVNAGTTELAPPVELLVDGLPAGLSVLGAEGLDGLLGAGGWRCADDRCTLVDSTTGDDVGIGPGGFVPASIRLSSPATPIAPTTVTITALSAGATIAETTLDLGDAEGSFPGVVDVDAPIQLEFAARAVTVVRVEHTLATAVSAGEVTVVGLAPEGATDLSIDGAGWRCDTGQGGTCHWAGDGVEAGEALPDISASFVPPIAAAVGGEIGWDTVVTLSRGDESHEYRETNEAAVVATLEPQASVLLNVIDAASVARPGSVRIAAEVLVRHAANATGPIEVAFDAPPGIELRMPEGFDDRWSCTDDGGELTCSTTDHTVFADAGESEPTVVVVEAHVDVDTSLGEHAVGARVDVPGARSGETGDDAAVASVLVMSGEVPMLTLTRYEPGLGGDLVRVRDGRAAALEAGNRLVLGVRNQGSAPTLPGDLVQMHLVVPAGVVLAATSEQASCRGDGLGGAPVRLGTAWTCELVLDRPLAPDAESPPIEMTVVSIGHTTRTAMELPLRLTHRSGDTEPSVTDHTVDAVAAGPGLELGVDVAGIVWGAPGAGELAVTVANDGVDGVDWEAILSLPDGVDADGEGARLVATTPGAESADEAGVSDGRLSGVVCEPFADPYGLTAASADRLLRCSSADPMPGETSATLLVPAAAARAAQATLGVVLGVPARPALGTASARIPVHIAEAIDAVAVAEPMTVTDVVDTVTLDGRASIGDGLYTWRQVPEPGQDEVPVRVDWLDGSTGRVVRFARPRVAMATELTFELTVTSPEGGASGTDVVTVVVEPDGRDPVAGALADVRFDGGGERSTTGAAGAETMSVGRSLVQGNLLSTNHPFSELPPLPGWGPFIEVDDYVGDQLSPALSAHAAGQLPLGTAYTAQVVRWRCFDPDTSGLGPCADRNHRVHQRITCPLSDITDCTTVAYPADYGSLFGTIYGPLSVDETTPTVPSLVRYRLAYDTGSFFSGYTTNFYDYWFVVDGPHRDTSGPAPGIEGVVETVGDPLRVDPGAWFGAPDSFDYLVEACVPTDGTTCRELASASGVAAGTEWSFAPDLQAVRDREDLRVTVTASRLGVTNTADPISVGWRDGWFRATGPGWTSALPVDPAAPPFVEAAALGTTVGFDLSPLLPAADVDANQIVTSSLQWLRCPTADRVPAVGDECDPITGATAPTFTAGPADVGLWLGLEAVVTTAIAGSVASTIRLAPALVQPIAPTNLVPPTIVPGPEAGTWGADPGIWDDPVDIGYEYRWQVCDVGCVDPVVAVDPADPAHFVMDASEAGSELQLEVRGVNWADRGPDALPGPWVAATRVTLELPAPVLDSAPSIDTTAPAVGALLSVDPGAWRWLTTAPTVAWERCGDGDDMASCTPIIGADAPIRRLVSDDAGSWVRAIVTAVNASGTVVVATAPVGPVTADDVGVARAPQVVLDPRLPVPAVGVALTAEAGEYSLPPGSPDAIADPATWTTQWQRCEGPDTCVDIAGATGRTYLPGTGDTGATVRIVESFTTDAGRTISTPSVQTAPVADPSPQLQGDPPALLGEAVVGLDLVVETGLWTGLAPPEPGIVVTWQRCERGGACAEAGSGERYTVQAGDAGLRLQATVTATNDWGSVSATTSRTAPVRFVDGPSVVIEVPDEGIDTVNGETVTLRTTTVATGEPGYTWTQTAGPAVLSGVDTSGPDLRFTVPATGVGELGFRVELTQVDGQTTTDEARVRYAPTLPSAAPAGMCRVLSAVAAGDTSVRLGRVSLSFGSGSVSSARCNGDVVASFTGARFVMDGVFDLVDASGTVSAAGVVLRSGELRVGDGAFAGLDLRLVGEGLRVGFGASPSVTGDFVAAGLFGIASPAGWQATTRLRFTGESGAAAIRVDAVAHRAGDRSVPVVDALPAPPASLPHLRIGGSYAVGGRFALDVAAVGLVDLGAGASIDMTGRVTRPAAGEPVVVAVGASFAEPIVIGDVATITSGSVTYTDGTVTGAVQVQVAGRILLDGDLRASGRDDWQISLAARSNGRVRLAPGLAFDDATVTGELTRRRGGTEARLTVAAAAWQPVDGVVLENVSATLGTGCATAPCGTTLDVAAEVVVTLDGVSTRGRIAGTVDPDTGGFALRAEVSAIDLIPGVDIRTLTVDISSRAAGRAAVTMSLTAEIAGAEATGALNVFPGGWAIDLAVDRVTLFPGAPTIADFTASYSSRTRTVTLPAGTRSVAARTLVVAGTTGLPAWLEDVIGIDADETRIAGIVDLANRSVELSADLGIGEGSTLLDVAGLAIEADSLAYVAETTASGVRTGVQGDVVLRLPGMLGMAPTSVPLAFAGTTGTDGFSASMALRPGTEWRNAFGIGGLHVRELAVSISNGPAGPGIGLAGTAVLPPSIAGPLGIRRNTPVTLAATIGGAGPAANCFAFEIGDGTSRAVDVIDAGVLTADRAQLVLAPTGCAIGTHVFAPGLSFAFDGAIFGAGVAVEVAVDPGRLALDGRVEVGTIDLVGLTVDDVFVEIEASPTTRRLAFAGGIDLLGASGDVAGEFTVTRAGPELDLAGRFSGFELAGFELGEMEATVRATDRFRNLEIAAAASTDVLGTAVDWRFDLAVDNGRVERADGTAELDRDWDQIRIDAIAEIAIVSGQVPDVTFRGSMETVGVDVASVEGRVDSRGASMRARLAIPKVLHAELAGWMAYDDPAAPPAGLRPSLVVGGVPEGAVPGDFELRADDVSIGVRGFELDGEVAIGMLDGTPFAALDAELELGVAGAAQAEVALTADLAAERFSLDGAAAIRLLDQDVADAAFSVAFADDGELALSFEGTVDIEVATIVLAGRFERSPGYGTLFRIHGDVDLEIGGFDLGATRMMAYRHVNARPATYDEQLRGTTREHRSVRDRGIAALPLVDGGCPRRACRVEAGVFGLARFGAPAIGDLEMAVRVSASGDLSIQGFAQFQGALGDALGGASASVRLSTADGVGTLSMRATAKDLFGVPVTATARLTLTSTGRLDVGLSAVAGPYGGRVNLRAVQGKATVRVEFSVDMSLDVTSPARIEPRASFVADVGAWVRWYEFWEFWDPGWSSWQRVLGFQLAGSTQPLRLSVAIDAGAFRTSIRVW